jgi:hypothetical protein
MSETRSEATNGTMKDPERLRIAGHEDDRALLRAAEPPIPPQVKETVRRAIEERLFAGGRGRSRWRLGWALAGTLVAGTALAYGVAELRASRRSGRVPSPSPSPSEVHAPRRAQAPAIEAPAPEPTSPAEQPLPGRTPAARPPRSPSARPVAAAPANDLGWVPGLSAPPTGAPEPPRPSPPPGPSRLVISSQHRRDIVLEVRGNRIEGQVRGAGVSFEVRPVELEGKVDGEPVRLWMHQETAEGSIAGHEVGFYLSPTDSGAVVRGNVPGNSMRIEVKGSELSFFPGCQRPLSAQPATPGADGIVYQGTCASGRFIAGGRALRPAAAAHAAADDHPGHGAHRAGSRRGRSDAPAVAASQGRALSGGAGRQLGDAPHQHRGPHGEQDAEGERRPALEGREVAHQGQERVVVVGARLSHQHLQRIAAADQAARGLGREHEVVVELRPPRAQLGRRGEHGGRDLHHDQERQQQRVHRPACCTRSTNTR